METKIQSNNANKEKKRAIAKTILRANAAMIFKQGSLLQGWAYTTSRATYMGNYVMAAHQMALSIWMVLSFMLDDVGVAEHVLSIKIIPNSMCFPNLLNLFFDQLSTWGLREWTYFLIFLCLPASFFLHKKIVQQYILQIYYQSDMLLR